MCGQGLGFVIRGSGGQRQIRKSVEEKEKTTQRKEVRRRCSRGNAQRKRLDVELSSRLISRSVRSRVVAGGLTPVSPVSYPVSLSAWLISAEPQPADAVGWLIWLTARLNVSAHTAQYVLDCGAPIAGEILPRCARVLQNNRTGLKK